ncbi:O-antigen ligase domain-containing protein [Roseococcus sp. SDR]|uniref:O-antigen ligase family protein n=1 Tax=Roseococcus sp. SDR TaxID=2835532 RepID=UPI001BCA97E5|nr:O-antigen ligase family protein [Roseococcus sp. SDR]MBS7792378.1 O-antigen ligase domain-containing protein [Roseococcus sp. SDR]MBV1847692.1 O-antigen ligase domain-containing protein [Roseococcus sp. SDR]
MIRTAPLFAALAGLAGAVLHFAGALKSTQAVAALPFDITLLALLALLGLLPLLLLGRAWQLSRALGPPLAACGLLWAWWVLAAAWSPWGEGVADRLPEIVLAGPLMLALGLLIGADPAARRVFAVAVIGLGVFVAASIAWGLATDAVVLGGQVGADPSRVRVQYQVAGLAIACAAGLVALRATAARGWGVLVWLAVLLGLGVGVLLPGGRAALLELVAVVALAPALRWLLQGRVAPAVGWVALVAAGGAMGLGLLLLDPGRAEDLATLERLFRPDGGQDSAREILWGEAWRLGGVMGLGPGGFPPAIGVGQDRGLHPHNHAIEALVEGGAVGLILWLAAFGGAALLALTRLPRVAPDRAALILALTLPVAMTAMVSTDLGNRMVWFALGLALSLGLEARDA